MSGQRAMRLHTHIFSSLENPSVLQTALRHLFAHLSGLLFFCCGFKDFD
jgi:hypothetical protein